MTKKAVNIFGRKFFILNGDFRQVLPVVQYGGRAKEITGSILCVLFWRYQDYSLIEYMHARDKLCRLDASCWKCNRINDPEGEIEISQQNISSREEIFPPRDSGTNKHRDARRKEEIAVWCVKSTRLANLLRKLIKGIAQQF